MMDAHHRPAGRPTISSPSHDDDDDARAARRAWIRAHHPDAGGDPDAFASGLATFGPSASPNSAPARPNGRPTVYRSRTVARVLVRSLREARRRLEGRPPRNLR